MLKDLANYYLVKKAGNPYRDENGHWTSKEKAKTIAEWWNEGGKEKTVGAATGAIIGSKLGGVGGALAGNATGAIIGAGLGSLAGGIGAIPGAALGSVVGGAAGVLGGMGYGGYKGFRKGKEMGEEYYEDKKSKRRAFSRYNSDKAQKSELLTDLSNYYLAKKMSFA